MLLRTPFASLAFLLGSLLALTLLPLSSLLLPLPLSLLLPLPLPLPRLDFDLDPNL